MASHARNACDARMWPRTPKKIQRANQAAEDELTVKTAPMEQAQQAHSDATSKLDDESIKTVFEVNQKSYLYNSILVTSVLVSLGFSFFFCK